MSRRRINEAQVSGRSFWRWWVAANLIGEVIGLGTVACGGFLMIYLFGEPKSPGHTLAFAAVVIGLGAVEGMVVGYAQTRVLRTRLSGIRSWTVATVIGAVAAWILGMVPSTLMSLASPTQSGPPPEISDIVQIMLAIPMGLIAGLILSFPQWRVLRRYVARAGLWLPANALAWAAGMPLIFAAVGASAGGSALFVIAAVLAGIAGAGAVVGAIHGWFLVRLLNNQR